MACSEAVVTDTGNVTCCKEGGVLNGSLPSELPKLCSQLSTNVTRRAARVIFTGWRRLAFVMRKKSTDTFFLW